MNTAADRECDRFAEIGRSVAVMLRAASIGDFEFAQSLQRNLRRIGVDVRLGVREKAEPSRRAADSRKAERN